MSSPFWTPVAEASVLGTAGIVCLFLAWSAFQRREVRGSRTFAWMLIAIGHWCALSALHTLAKDAGTRMALAQVQYFGIAAVPPLWYFFARAFRGQPAASFTGRDLLLWVVPVLTVAAAFTNEWHGALWREIHPASAEPGARLIYVHGVWFWIAVAVNYALLAGGTWHILQALRRNPPQYRGQSAALAAGAAVPWLGNALYLAGATPAPGFDPTPVSFVVSAAFLAAGMFQYRLFDLVPIARDQLFDRLQDAVFVLDPQFRVLDLNAAARMLVITAREGQPIAEVLPWWTGVVDQQRDSPGRPLVVAHEGRSFDIAITPVNDARNRFAGWLLVVHDITERLRDEAQRRALERRLQDQQHVETLSVLAGGLAHDFNNLLAGVMGNADLLALELPPAATDLREMAGAIATGAERAADLVEKMLAYAGEGRGVPAEVSLASLIPEMVDLLKASVARHCDLEYEVDDAVPNVLGDATQIRQILLNLIVNAAEAHDGSGGRIMVRAKSTQVLPGEAPPASRGAALAPGHYAFLEVSDTGRGMPQAVLDRVFDPFFTTKDSGRGLGLASVHGIVRGHRGAIMATSVLNRGTTFKVWLPSA